MNNLYKKTIFSMICLSFVVANLMGQNLLVNPDFETGNGVPWVSGGTNAINLDTVTVHQGKFSSVGNVEQYIDLEADTNYVLECWAYNTTSDINTWVGIRDVTPGGVLVQNFLLDSAGYQYVRIEFKAPSTGSHRFWAWGQANSVYHTDSWVLLKEGTFPTSIGKLRNDKIKIWNQPNQITINIEDFRYKATINIYELTGKMIHSEETTDAKTVIPNSTFGQTGSYFVQVKTKEGFLAKQVMITNE